MLLKNAQIATKNEKEAAHFEENNLVVYNLGCYIARADSTKLFYLLKDKIKEPTLIIIVCNVTKASTARVRKSIIELKEKYYNYKIFITGCVNELVEDKYNKLGIIVYKKDMWELENYE